MAAGQSTTLHVAIPAMNEYNYIGKTLSCLQEQSFDRFHVWICVNHPEAFRADPEKSGIIVNNEQTIDWLKGLPLKNLHIIDRCTKGNGWQGSHHGVGIARKTIMDAIAAHASQDDIIVSMDADTTFEPGFLESVCNAFNSQHEAMALANPYYHPLIGDPVIDRAILRYEIYMRYYALNLRFCNTPFCFSPLGSSMSCRVWAYKKVKGLTPKKSGEDFYFLQKIAKSGKIMMYNPSVVYPGTRLSDRVYFGTGPALIKGIEEGWAAYPLFNPAIFEEIKQTLSLFPVLFESYHPTPMDDFLNEHFREKDIFEPLRKNHKDRQRFVKACHEKVDGLRILQYAKLMHSENPGKDEENLILFLKKHFSGIFPVGYLENLDFLSSDIGLLNKIRNFLFETELKLQKDEANQ